MQYYTDENGNRIFRKIAKEVEEYRDCNDHPAGPGWKPARPLAGELVPISLEKYSELKANIDRMA